MVVKVYGPLKAACPQRVMVCLLEKEVEFEVIPIDLDSGHQKLPDYVSKQVPFSPLLHRLLYYHTYIVMIIINSNFIKISESRAIIRYYAAKYADKGADLVGQTLEEKALVDQWLEVEAHNLNDPIYAAVLQLVILPRMGLKTDVAVVGDSEDKIGKVLDVYERRLSESKYLAGEKFTLADLSNLPGLRYLTNEAGMGHLVRDRKKVNAWWEDISGRPAWKKLMAMAGL
ncbi:Glutathione S-transferase F11 [Linum perenne]